MGGFKQSNHARMAQFSQDLKEIRETLNKLEESKKKTDRVTKENRKLINAILANRKINKLNNK